SRYGRAAIPTGITIALPDLVEAQVIAPPEWSLETPLAVLNSPGTIDPDYRGEIHVLLINLSESPVTIIHGQEIAELRAARFTRFAFAEIE
ncbi:dUTP diphosphatase, partial [Microcoleus sp.]|uniref:dUTP diphosphatase n=1 Tax=Microcoleus sp. TaxID=44472 RepID=UPI0035250634